MASVLAFSRWPPLLPLLLLLLATASRALKIGDLLGTPPAVRTREGREPSEFL
jgi:hypothetical protein